MLAVLANRWPYVLIRGICAIIFGIIAFAWPGITLFTLVVLFGIYVLVDGIFALVTAMTPAGRGSVGWLVLVGILGIAAGVVTFFYPMMTAVVLISLIGAWAVVKGIIEIVAAVQLRKEIRHEWLLALAGTFSVLFGLILWVRPAAGVLALIWVLGLYAILFGIVEIGLSLRLRSLKTHLPETGGAATA